MGVTSGLLDTSVVVAGFGTVEQADLPTEMAVSVVTIGELHAGVLLATAPLVRAARLARLVDVHREFTILDVTPMVAQCFGELRARSGQRAVADLLIAATAQAHGMVLVTRDKRQATLAQDDVVLIP